MSRLLEHDLFGTVPTKKKINSKKKGDKNERLCASTFLLSWTGEQFARVPSSGGLRWANNSSVCGDLVCENEDFNFIFALETKHLKSLGLPKTKKLRSNSGLFKIWSQAKRDAERAGKHPLVALRENGFKKGSYVIVVDQELPLEYAYIGTRDKVTLYCYWSSDILKYFPYDKAIKFYGT